MRQQIQHQFHARKEKGRAKPDGGFTFIPAEALLATWFAYRRDFIRLADLRVWLACFELVARRNGSIRRLQVCYRLDEVQALTGIVATQSVRASISRLETAGLMSWSETRIELNASTAAWDAQAADRFASIIASVANHRRRVPVPRRVIRFLAGSRRPVMIATVLGHLLRCMYYRNGECVPNGTCKASWVADVFAVDVRNVKAARGWLFEIGLLEQTPTPQQRLNRWGLSIQFNLDWVAPGSGSPKSPPRRRLPTTESPPPYRDRNLSSRMYNNQKPAERGASGVWKNAGRPTLRHVVPDDLQHPARMVELHRQAVLARTISASESDRMKFFSAIQHARSVGTKNACGLFATMLRRGLWRFIGQRDEDSARRLLWTHLHGRGELMPRRGFQAPTEATRYCEGVSSILASFLSKLDAGTATTASPPS